MGKFVSLIKFTGRTGDVVGSKGPKGSYVTRAYQPTVANPSTEKQILQRAYFLAATSSAKAMSKVDPTSVINLAKQERITYANMFAKKWLKLKNTVFTHTQTSSGVNVAPDYTRFQVSWGPTCKASFAALILEDENIVGVAWDGDMLDSDRVHIIVIQPDTGSIVAATPIVGTEKTASVQVPTTWSGMKVHVYAYVQSFNDAQGAVEYDSGWEQGGVFSGATATIAALVANSECSASVYLGTGNIA